ncbi:MAG: rhomboid family intramembrane serine protease, partial [bacterium]
MIPLKDTEPCDCVPFVNVAIILANVVVFIVQLSQGAGLEAFVQTYAVIPARYFDSQWMAQASLGDALIPFFSSMFLHGGIVHLVGNLWVLWIFGDNIESRLGHFKYLLFYLICGLGAGVTHVVTNPNSLLPTLGASGAIAGVMGGYFLLYPRARVITLVPVFYFLYFLEIPAFLFLGFWFLLQFWAGSTTFQGGADEVGGVAWWAHVGGFLIGMLLTFLIATNKPKRRKPQR